MNYYFHYMIQPQNNLQLRLLKNPIHFPENFPHLENFHCPENIDPENFHSRENFHFLEDPQIPDFFLGIFKFLKFLIFSTIKFYVMSK